MKFPLLTALCAAGSLAVSTFARSEPIPTNANPTTSPIVEHISQERVDQAMQRLRQRERAHVSGDKGGDNRSADDARAKQTLFDLKEAMGYTHINPEKVEQDRRDAAKKFNEEHGALREIHEVPIIRDTGETLIPKFVTTTRPSNAGDGETQLKPGKVVLQIKTEAPHADGGVSEAILKRRIEVLGQLVEARKRVQSDLTGLANQTMPRELRGQAEEVRQYREQTVAQQKSLAKLLRLAMSREKAFEALSLPECAKLLEDLDAKEGARIARLKAAYGSREESSCQLLKRFSSIQTIKFLPPDVRDAIIQEHDLTDHARFQITFIAEDNVVRAGEAFIELYCVDKHCFVPLSLTVEKQRYPIEVDPDIKYFRIHLGVDGKLVVKQGAQQP